MDDDADAKRFYEAAETMLEVIAHAAEQHPRRPGESDQSYAERLKAVLTPNSP